jgi:ATP-binding cassette subfamily B protein
MAFRREALLAVNGFDPVYRKAGDDVDLCWRLQQAGRWITFAPGAFVWHHRRQGPRAYLKQQAGYGEAEALLCFKHPDKFNARGEGRWRGVLYGGCLRGVRFGRPVVYHGTFATGLFQCVYQPGPAHWATLPATLEWHMAVGLVALAGVAWWPLWAVAGVMILLSVGVALLQAAQARLPAGYGGLASRLIVAGLCYAQPLLRSWKRYRVWIFAFPSPGRPDACAGDGDPLPLTGRREAAYWTEEWRDRSELLSRAAAYLAEHRWGRAIDSGWEDWDLELSGDRWTALRVRTAQEEHGGGRRLIRVAYQLRPRGTVSLAAAAGTAATALTALLAPVAAAVIPAALTAGFLAFVWRRGARLGGRAAQVVDVVAAEMNLVRCGRRPALLLAVAGLMVAVALLGQLVGLAGTLLGTYTGEKLVRSFRAVLFRHAQRLSLSYHDPKGTTDSTYRIQYDSPCIQWVVVDGTVPLVTSAFTLVAMVAVVTAIDWQLAAVALAVAPVLFLLTHVYGRRLRGQAKEVKRIESSALSVIQEVLAAVRVVKAFGQEDREHGRFVSQSDLGVRARLRIALGSGVLGLLVGLTVAVGTAAVLFIGVRHVQAGALTLGELLVVMAYLAQLYSPMETISKKVADLQGSMVSAERAFALLDETPDVADRADGRPIDRAAGAVSFRGVGFAYPGNPPVFRDVSFDVTPGTRVGVIGRTGAGKSTLMNLLTRFYDPAAGQIQLDGVDLRNYRLADLRNQFAIVLQDPVLFSVSVGENIAYARPGASQQEVEAAARAANAHEFITRLPDGYDTRVGERGMRLSGGERQRIALARAFLRDAPVLILDEPTSSVDVKTEGLILDALDRLMAGRTTFIIAHRLTTVRAVDRLLVVGGGRVEERHPLDAAAAAAGELGTVPAGGRA